MTAQYDGPKPIGGARPDERRLVFASTLKRHDGNLAATAKALGVSHKTAWKWYHLLRDGTLLERFSAEEQEALR